MSSSGESTGDVFDPRRIRRLVDLMKAYDLSELDLRQGETEIRLRRGAAPSAAPAIAWQPPPMNYGPPANYAPPQPAPQPDGGSTPPAPAAPAVDDSKLHVIRSPMVGTFYASPSPDAAAYVKVGDHVGRDSTVCIIEAMKVFNEIQAEVTGQIVSVLVEGGQPVEFNQPLFKVDTGK